MTVKMKCYGHKVTAKGDCLTLSVKSSNNCHFFSTISKCQSIVIYAYEYIFFKASIENEISYKEITSGLMHQEYTCESFCKQYSYILYFS